MNNRDSLENLVLDCRRVIWIMHAIHSSCTTGSCNPFIMHHWIMQSIHHAPLDHEIHSSCTTGSCNPFIMHHWIMQSIHHAPLDHAIHSSFNPVVLPCDHYLCLFMCLIVLAAAGVDSGPQVGGLGEELPDDPAALPLETALQTATLAPTPVVTPAATPAAKSRWQLLRLVRASI